MTKHILAKHLKPATALMNGVDVLRDHIGDLKAAYRLDDAEDAMSILLALAEDATTLAKQAEELRQSIEEVT